MGKSVETRERLRQTAIRMLRERGYAKTTMRALAEEAGVSVGNAYYYFPTKDELVQELYLQIQVDHRAMLGDALETERDFATRLATVLHAGFRVGAPYHAFGVEFVGSALPPDAAASPFGDESGPARDLAVGLLREVVDGSDLRIPADLRRELPDLLWMLYMASMLFWVFDRSEGQEKTHLLIDRLVPLTARLIALAKLPLIKGQVDDVLEIVRMVRSL